MWRICVASAAALLLSACATFSGKTDPADYPDNGGPVAEYPGSVPGSGQGPISNPSNPGSRPPVTQPPITRPPIGPGNGSGPRPAPGPSGASVFALLPHWQSANMRPALTAFERSCAVWAKKPSSTFLNTGRPELGRISDWNEACSLVRYVGGRPEDARKFFETHFYPLFLSGPSRGTEGLVTGYYQPEIRVRRRAAAPYTEAILTVPSRVKDQNLPRSKVKASNSDVIAYGRPIDVFFMQVQGSGVLAFDDGRKVRAAFAGHNSHPYTSIGGVLVRAGYMTKEQASKQAIEKWMAEAGPDASRMLMNENKRYIYFQAENLVAGEGPKGAMGVPLTAMGSVAVDPAHHPYGLPLWITVKTPQFGGDYRALEGGHLLIAQDTGKAIKGLRRGDLYFGEGFDAGEKAGVMKHYGQWAVLLPRALLAGLAIS